MIVALGAVHAPAQKDPDLLPHGILRQRHGRATHIFVVAGGAVESLGGHPLPGELIVRLVLGNGPANPVLVDRADHPQEVVEAPGPVFHELGRSEQQVDEPVALLRVRVGQEPAHPMNGRQPAGQVQAETPQKLGVGGKR